LGFIHRDQIVCKAISLDQICDLQPEYIEPAFRKNLKSSNGIDRLAGSGNIEFYNEAGAFVNFSRTHIRTKLETPKPFWSATFFSSETVESSSLTATTRSFRRIRVFWSGRKSFTLTARSRSTSGGSAVYTIFFFIALLSFPPKGRSKNPDLTAPVSESYGHDLAEDFAKAKIPLLIIAVKRVVKDYTMLILECLLCILKRHPMLGDIVQILTTIVPFEIRRFHNHDVLQTSLFVNRITHATKKICLTPLKRWKIWFLPLFLLILDTRRETIRWIFSLIYG
jgi:hypothetical protein